VGRGRFTNANRIMTVTINRRFALFVLAGVVLAGAAGPGCSFGPQNAPVKAPLARETLRKALDSWKQGDKAEALQKASPPVYVIDPEWQGGAVLKDYQVIGEGEEKDAHLFCQVKLTVRSSRGREATTQATYVISTAPNLTVSRKLF
jgi:hypothetical protein